MSESSPPRVSTRAIARAFDVLEALRAEGGSGTVCDLAARVGLPQPTVHRILRTLVDGGYVFQVANRRYTLGLGLVDLARGAGTSLGASLRPMLSWAVAASGEPVSVAILDQDEAHYIAREPCDRPVPVFTRLGDRVCLHSTGVGKAILSTMADDEVEAVVGRIALTGRTPATITDPDALLVEIRRVREQGYALDRGEHEAEVVCVAAPVPGRLPIAVSISGPAQHMSADRVQVACLPVVRALAAQLGEACDQMATGPLDDAEEDGGWGRLRENAGPRWAVARGSTGRLYSD